MTTVSDSEVLFMFVTTNGVETARGKSGWLFMLRATFLHKNLWHITLRHVVLFRSSCLRDTTRQAMIQDREVWCDFLSSMF